MSGKVTKNYMINYLPPQHWNTCNSMYKYTYTVSVNYYHLSWQCFPPEPVIIYQNCNNRYEKQLCFRMLAREVQVIPQIHTLLLMHIVTPLKEEDKSLFLKITHTSETQRLLSYERPECCLSEYYVSWYLKALFFTYSTTHYFLRSWLEHIC